MAGRETSVSGERGAEGEGWPHSAEPGDPTPGGGGSAEWGRPSPSAPRGQALADGQVLSIHVYVDVGSPFGHPGGAVMFRIGIVMMRAGSRIGNGYSSVFLLNPISASL